jgi:hypothetical protein
MTTDVYELYQKVHYSDTYYHNVVKRLKETEWFTLHPEQIELLTFSLPFVCLCCEQTFRDVKLFCSTGCQRQARLIRKAQIEGEGGQVLHISHSQHWYTCWALILEARRARVLFYSLSPEE